MCLNYINIFPVRQSCSYFKRKELKDNTLMSSTYCVSVLLVHVCLCLGVEVIEWSTACVMDLFLQLFLRNVGPWKKQISKSILWLSVRHQYHLFPLSCIATISLTQSKSDLFTMLAAANVKDIFLYIRGCFLAGLCSPVGVCVGEGDVSVRVFLVCDWLVFWWHAVNFSPRKWEERSHCIKHHLGFFLSCSPSKYSSKVVKYSTLWAKVCCVLVYSVVCACTHLTNELTKLFCGCRG